MLKWIMLVVIPLLGLTIAAVCVRLDCKRKHPPICKTCEMLVRKDGGLLAYYYCKREGAFRSPPEICSHYESKKEADHG